MKRFLRLILLLSAMVAVSAFADGVGFDPQTGSMTVEQGGETLWKSGEHGLWRIRFRDNSFLSAADVATNGVANGTFRMESGSDGGTILAWTSPRADVKVRARQSEDGRTVDLSAEVSPKDGESLMMDFPAHLCFPAESVRDFIYPGNGNAGPGMAFNAKFYQPVSEDEPHGWQSKNLGSKGYVHLYGGGLKMIDLSAKPVALAVTEEGRKWFSHDAVGQFNRRKSAVVRPPAKNQFDVVLIDSEAGPYLSGKHFGGSGMLWRFGSADTSSSHEGGAAVETDAIRQMLPRLAQRSPSRRKVALVSLAGGPRTGGFVRTSVKGWRQVLEKSLPDGCEYEELRSVSALYKAIASKDYLLVLNPYGEFFPVDEPANFLARLDDVREYVRAGGNWVETGGYSFFLALHSERYLQMVVRYPPLFADFAQLVTTSGASVALYGVQPRTAHEPWKNPAPFVPGETGTGGDEQGGWFFHAFAACAKAGGTARTPKVRIRIGATLDDALADYSAVNNLTVSLAEKIKAPGAIEKFKRAPLLLMDGGSAATAKAALAECPVPTLYHLTGYLKGGFDKEYPDHLPPRESFGTMEELVDLFKTARERGHLVSPYTNPTWWCDHPRGPSFVAAGEAPLAVGLDGKPYHERYANNDGWTITFFHPDVQKANRKTVREFTQDAPVDLLFQDQCGARGWRWDFNSAAPSPSAYAEGMISMNEEDSRLVPIATEDGWDQVANRQTALCGCAWRVVPLGGEPPAWREYFKNIYPASTWRMEPVNLRLFHDKLFFYMHDLGGFVTNERILAWMFALGYNLSYNCDARAFTPESPRFKWYSRLHVLQTHVISRIAGKPLLRYHHDRTPLFERKDTQSNSENDDGVVVAQWGDVSVVVNLGDVARTVQGHRLAPFGWWIEGDGMKSAHLEGEAAFVEADGGRWVF